MDIRVFIHYTEYLGDEAITNLHKNRQPNDAYIYTFIMYINITIKRINIKTSRIMSIDKELFKS